MSHDMPLDAALHLANASDFVKAGPPLLLADRRLVDMATLSTVQRTIGHRFGGLSRVIEVPPLLAQELQMPAGKYPLQKIGDRVAELASDLGFLHESDGATVLANANRHLEAHADPSDHAASSRRFLQAQVFEYADAKSQGTPRTVSRAFRPDAPMKYEFASGPRI